MLNTQEKIRKIRDLCKEEIEIQDITDAFVHGKTILYVFLDKKHTVMEYMDSTDTFRECPYITFQDEPDDELFFIKRHASGGKLYFKHLQVDDFKLELAEDFLEERYDYVCWNLTQKRSPIIDIIKEEYYSELEDITSFIASEKNPIVKSTESLRPFTYYDGEEWMVTIHKGIKSLQFRWSRSQMSSAYNDGTVGNWTSPGKKIAFTLRKDWFTVFIFEKQPQEKNYEIIVFKNNNKITDK